MCPPTKREARSPDQATREGDGGAERDADRALTLELWIRPRAELYAKPYAFLLEKKYMHYAAPGIQAGDNDYCLLLQKAGDEQVALAASLGGVTRFRAELEPGGGKIFVIADRLPATVRVSAPSEMERGKTAVFDIAVLDPSGAPVAAVVPFEIRVEDPAFRLAEPTGFYAAVSGKARVAFDLAENERTGLWRVTVTERLTGTTRTTYVPVR